MSRINPLDQNTRLVSYIRDTVLIDKKPGFRYIKDHDCIYFLNSNEKIEDYKNISPSMSVYFGGKPFKNIVGILFKNINQIVSSGIGASKRYKGKGVRIDTKEDLDNLLKSLRKNSKDAVFVPTVWYNVYGDQIEAYLSNCGYCGKYINPYLTTFISHDTEKLMGVEICGIKKLLGHEK